MKKISEKKILKINESHVPSCLIKKKRINYNSRQYKDSHSKNGSKSCRNIKYKSNIFKTILS